MNGEAYKMQQHHKTHEQQTRHEQECREHETSVKSHESVSFSSFLSFILSLFAHHRHAHHHTIIFMFSRQGENKGECKNEKLKKKQQIISKSFAGIQDGLYAQILVL